MKIPLLIQNDARDPNRAKDSWAINSFLEQDDFARIVKRPGLTLTMDGTEVGDLGQGVFIWPSSDGPIIATIVDDVLWLYNDDYEIEDAVDLDTAISLTYDPLASYTPGDRVLYTYGPIVPDGWVPNVKVVWYCVANVTGIAPAHSNAAYTYWSLYPNKPGAPNPTTSATWTYSQVFQPPASPYEYIIYTTLRLKDSTGLYDVIYSGTASHYDGPFVPGNTTNEYVNYSATPVVTLINGYDTYPSTSHTTTSNLPQVAANDYARSHQT